MEKDHTKTDYNIIIYVEQEQNGPQIEKCPEEWFWNTIVPL